MWWQGLEQPYWAMRWKLCMEDGRPTREKVLGFQMTVKLPYQPHMFTQTVAWKRKRTFYYVAAVTILGLCFSSWTTFWICTSFQCFYMKISSVLHNQTGLRAKIIRTIFHLSNNDFWVSTTALDVKHGGCPDCSYLPVPLTSVSLTWSSPRYLSSLLLSTCDVACLEQATVHPGYSLAAASWPVFPPLLPVSLSLDPNLLRGPLCQRARSPSFLRLTRPCPLLKPNLFQLCSSHKEPGEIFPVSSLRSGAHSGCPSVQHAGSPPALLTLKSFRLQLRL